MSDLMEVKRLNELSKSGNEREALDAFTRLYNEGSLEVNFHESMGWAIYRLIKRDGATMGSNAMMRL